MLDSGAFRKLMNSGASDTYDGYERQSVTERVGTDGSGGKMGYGIGDIWDAGTSLVGKGRNLLSGNGWKADATPAEMEAMMRKKDGSWLREAAQSDLDRENRRFTSNAFMDAANRAMAIDEQNRQIAQAGAQQAAQLASMYPEIWAAKRKARYQTGALSALGGV